MLSDIDVEVLSLSDEPREDAPIGIIGGWGFTNRLDARSRISVETPYGDPTHPVVIGEMGGQKVAFLSRHGQGRNVPSHSISYRANMFALYRVGVKRIIAATANGSLRSEIGIGEIAIPTDYIDRTKQRSDTFFSGYPPRHFANIQPFCPEIGKNLDNQGETADLRTHNEDITLIVPEGPRYATVAESKMYRDWGADIIGHSVYPEVALARELGLCYANFGLITDYDTGVSVPGTDEDHVDLHTVDERLEKYNVQTRTLMEATIEGLEQSRCESCKGHVSMATSEGDPTWEYRRTDIK